MFEEFGAEICFLVHRQIAVYNSVHPIVFALLVIGVVKDFFGNLFYIIHGWWLDEWFQVVRQLALLNFTILAIFLYIATSFNLLYLFQCTLI